ncbi:MAG: GntR family transcriptional regulator [Actinomycetes bacterium]
MAIAKPPALLPPALKKSGGGSLANQLRDQLRTRILAHEWGAGKKIPSEFDLAAYYQLSRVTVRTALKALEAQGLIDIRHGSGAYVANFGSSIRAGLQELRSITDTIHEMGLEPGMTHRVVKRRGATAEEASRLQISEDEPVLYMERAILADDEVVAYSYDAVAIRDLPEKSIGEMGKGSVFGAFAKLGIFPVRALAEIHAISSTEVGWGRGRPKSGLYLLLKQLHFLRDGVPVMASDTYFVEGRFQFIIHRTL